jgi:uncharacterized protein YecE (DUF72 family)
LQIYVGCSGWSYTSWDGHFYPIGIQPRQYIEYYSKVFDYAEIDSSFYKIPDRFRAIRWAKLTPDSFRFTAKFPGLITHDKSLAVTDDDMSPFFENMLPLKEKLLCLLIQLPPSMDAEEGLKKLQTMIIPRLSPNYRYAIEVRHKSWFEKDVYKYLTSHKICLAWSQQDAIQTPPEITTDFIYLRLIGDRSIADKDFGKVQKDRTKEMEKWAARIKAVRDKVKFGIVVANNHYSGFGPATANSMRKLLGMNEVVWEEMKQGRLGS